MPALLLRRVRTALASAALLLGGLPAHAALPGAPPAPSPVEAPGLRYTEAELQMIHEEAVATGGSTYTFYLLGSDDRDVIQAAWQQLEDGRAKGLRMKTLFQAKPRQQPTYALPIPLREQLRRLANGEHSGVFALDKRQWAIVEMESIDAATGVPVFEALRNSLPKLVATGAIPEPRDLTGNAALAQRSLMNKATTTTAFDLLPPGFDIDMPLSSGFTLLQRSLLRDDLPMVTATLTRAANANLCLMRSCPLVIAVRSDTRAAAFVSALLAAGARPDQTSAPGEDTPLTLASMRGNLDTVRALLQAGASRSGGDGPNLPLGVAAYKGNHDVVQLLLDKGADPVFRKPGPDGGFITPVANALTGQKADVVALLRAAARKQAATRKANRWSYWIEQDGEKVPLAGGRHHLKRKPFTLFVKLPAGSELRLEASTSPRLFEEYKAADLGAPLYQLSRIAGELHDGSARTLLVSDYAARSAAPAKHGGIQAWTWNESRKDFSRQEKTAQGVALAREIAALVLDDNVGKTEIPLEKSRVREISLLVGTSLDYSPAVGDYANARKLRLVFDR